MGLFDLFSGKSGRDAAMFAAQQLQQGQQQANSALDTGLGAATGLYNQAGGLYAGLAGAGQPGLNAYQDAVGAAGPEGYARATANFQANPGYQFAMNQGLDNLDRRAAARGMLGSGNTNLDTIKYSQGLANQEYGNYVNRLLPLADLFARGTAGQASTLTGLGDLNYGVGANKAGVATRTAEGIANAGTQGLLAGQKAAANAWNAGIQGLGLGLNTLSGLGGGGQLSGLRTLFGLGG